MNRTGSIRVHGAAQNAAILGSGVSGMDDVTFGGSELKLWHNQAAKQLSQPTTPNPELNTVTPLGALMM